MLLDKQLIAGSNSKDLKKHQRKFNFTAEGIADVEGAAASASDQSPDGILPGD